QGSASRSTSSPLRADKGARRVPVAPRRVPLYSLLYIEHASIRMPRNRSKALEISGSLEVSRRGQRYLGGNRVRLLEAIERTGSISQAAREVGMSYKGAW